ncbi:MAG: hypothetical protein ACLGHN_13310 [Bacteriovoracia bacterium]
MKILICVLSLYLMSDAYGEEQKVIYQYKKYEKFDLGNLEVKGELIAPGDISVRDRERRRFEMDLFSRKDFDGFIKKDVESLR